MSFEPLKQVTQKKWVPTNSQGLKLSLDLVFILFFLPGGLNDYSCNSMSYPFSQKIMLQWKTTLILYTNFPCSSWNAARMTWPVIGQHILVSFCLAWKVPLLFFLDCNPDICLLGVFMVHAKTGLLHSFIIGWFLGLVVFCLSLFSEILATSWWQLKVFFMFIPIPREMIPTLTSIFFSWVETTN